MPCGPEARDRLQEHGPTAPRRCTTHRGRRTLEPDAGHRDRTPDTGTGRRTPARGRRPRKRRDGRVLTSGSGQSHGRRRVHRRPLGGAGHCRSDCGRAGCGATAGHRWRTLATDGTQPADTLDADTLGSPTAADHRALARMAHLDCGGGYGRGVRPWGCRLAARKPPSVPAGPANGNDPSAPEGKPAGWWTAARNGRAPASVSPL
jgi:hypothetical protein